MKWTRKIAHCLISDVGMRRKNNEDTALVQLCPDASQWETTGHLFLVADGMGGHAVGELASKIASETVPHAYQKSLKTDRREALEEALVTANQAINSQGVENPEFERMGTTCSTLVLYSKGVLIGHVGDSRVYRVRRKQIEQLTFDHSLQWETRGPDAEQVMPRNVITRCLGPEAEVQPDIEGPFPVASGDRYVLCSDGLTGHLSDSDIGAIVGSLPCADATQMLVNLANLRGGSDNCTVVIANLGQVESSEDAVEESQQPTTSASPKTLITIVGSLIAATTALTGISLLTVVNEQQVQRLFPRVHNGVLFLLFAAIAIIATLIARKSLSTKKDQPADPAETDARKRTKPTLFQHDRKGPPYQKASAKLTKDFIVNLLNQLDEATSAPIVSELDVDWDTITECRSAAHSSLADGKLKDALATVATGLNALMQAVAERRREIDVANRWGETTAPTKPSS